MELYKELFPWLLPYRFFTIGGVIPMKGGLPITDQSKVTSKDLSGVYAEIADLLGIDATRKLHAAFHGQQITLPVHFYSREFLEKQILNEYDGTNIKALATKYNYSEKWVRKIVRESEEKRR
ncbi:MAG: hypothetical protein IJL34_03045 [Treponema sp.]|nr:hypothetical protein [Treponema sp.]